MEHSQAPESARISHEDLQFSDEELAIVKEFEVAHALAEMTRLPGWKIYCELIDQKMVALQKKHDADTDRMTDACIAASQRRLQGIREFVKAIRDQIVTQVDIFNQPLNPRRHEVNPLDLDGEFYEHQQ